MTEFSFLARLSRHTFIGEQSKINQALDARRPLYFCRPASLYSNRPFRPTWMKRKTLVNEYLIDSSYGITADVRRAFSRLGFVFMVVPNKDLLSFMLNAKVINGIMYESNKTYPFLLSAKKVRPATANLLWSDSVRKLAKEMNQSPQG